MLAGKYTTLVITIALVVPQALQFTDFVSPPASPNWCSHQSSPLSPRSAIKQPTRQPGSRPTRRLSLERRPPGGEDLGVDHAAGAAQVGLQLPPTEVLIFGNPKAGTLLMQDDQRIGLDLPLKVLVWQDGGGQTWLSYHDPRWLADGYGIRPERKATVEAMRSALDGAVRQAAEAP